MVRQIVNESIVLHATVSTVTSAKLVLVSERRQHLPAEALLLHQPGFEMPAGNGKAIQFPKKTERQETRPVDEYRHSPNAETGFPDRRTVHPLKRFLVVRKI
jgi:hypothetical protein